MGSTAPNAFRKQAETFAKYGSKYPTELFEFLSKQTDGHDLALDFATGNGQAAKHLAKFYKKVIATDPSPEQIKFAFPVPNVDYHCSSAELRDEQLVEYGINDASVDLITVASSVHYFDMAKFNPLVKRLLKNDGVYAVWCLGDITYDNTALTEIVRRYEASLWEFAPAHLHLWKNHYKDLPFPFDEITSFPNGLQADGSAFEIAEEWTMDQYFGWMAWWGITQRAIEKYGVNPLDKIRNDVRCAWGDTETNMVRFKIYMRVGRNRP